MNSCRYRQKLASCPRLHIRPEPAAHCNVHDVVLNRGAITFGC